MFGLKVMAYSRYATASWGQLFLSALFAMNFSGALVVLFSFFHSGRSDHESDGCQQNYAKGSPSICNSFIRISLHRWVHFRFCVISFPDIFPFIYTRQLICYRGCAFISPQNHFTPYLFTPHSFHPTFISPHIISLHIHFTPRSFHPLSFHTIL